VNGARPNDVAGDDTAMIVDLTEMVCEMRREMLEKEAGQNSMVRRPRSGRAYRACAAVERGKASGDFVGGDFDVFRLSARRYSLCRTIRIAVHRTKPVAPSCVPTKKRRFR